VAKAKTASKKSGNIFIGIGGWTFEPWRGVFYPEKLTQAKELSYAASKLTSIEINGTYYGELSQMGRRSAGGVRVFIEGTALRHQPPRARRGRRFDQAVL
jgi:hypothetical protein